jgi:NADPH-dependent 2,4-dienoyl-CoA reductase/sulfur reductase-like enzyme
MNNYDYLIVGGGMTAAAAADGIREVDADGSIGMFTSEPDPPYNRPPLSKALWKGKGLETIWRKTKKVHLHVASTISRLAPSEHRVMCADGTAYDYGKLLLATGGMPRRLPFEHDAIIYFRTLADYRRLRTLTATGSRFAVVGGGFIGSEIAAALAIAGKEVVMIFTGTDVCGRIFPRALAEFVSGYYRKKGIKLLPGEKVVAVETRGTQQVLTTAGGQEISVDGVVAGIGLEPNIALAEAAGIKTDNGIVVDPILRANQPDIYAAGDVASFYNPALKTHVRVEHEDNANSMGGMAGRNMAGKSERYDHLPSFYSDLFDLGYEAVGQVDARLDTFADWKQPNKEGVIYYLDNGRVRGVLLWNVWGKVEAAGELIAQAQPLTAEVLKSLLKY